MFSTQTFVVVFVIGAITAVFSGISALVESDLKQMVALSTASQMGLALMFVGMCDTRLAFLHISAHAVFKSLLFWGVGILNHIVTNQYTPIFRF